MKAFRYAIVFTVGVAVGCAATFKYADKKYSEISREEIDSVKRAFQTNENTGGVKHLSKELGKISVDDVAEPYISHSKTPEKVEPIHEPVTALISPDDFGELPDYQEITLYWSESDRELLDDQKDPVDISITIGSKSMLTHFGDYEDDAVYVRNDERKCDYQVLLVE